jgi:hypothetical protein
VLRLPWAVPFLTHPMLAFAAPAVVLPCIARDLLRSRWSYLWRFLLLLPMCLAGNLVWAAGFRRQALALRGGVAPASVRNPEAVQSEESADPAGATRPRPASGRRTIPTF